MGSADLNLPAPRFGAAISTEGIRFSVWSGAARRIWVSIFDDDGAREMQRIELESQGDGVHSVFVPGLNAGTRYGFRADGDHAPERGLWFDPDKLLMDPYAVAIDRAYVFDPKLSARQGEGGDTAPLMPKAVAMALSEPISPHPPLFKPGGLIYEVPVCAFTMLHPEIPKEQRGTIAALAYPAIVKHLQKLGVGAVELMPITAWIDERHLPPLGLSNAWGYNPVTFMALDPRLAPGGIAELRETVATLREAGIGVILDLVFNHTAESDELGPRLSLRGLDNQAYYRHGSDGQLVNDTGTGNTLACDRPIVQEMVLDTLRHFVRHAGVDGFRFDLAPILGRTESGFDPNAPLLKAMSEDAELADRMMIAEPWDIGPGGYQLGNFKPPFLEWNDKYRDDIRRFWRGDRGMIGALATRLAGSSDVFSGAGSRSVNFIAAHDGMTLADLTAYERKHNEANGEQNRDGHNENLSWNNGVEGVVDLWGEVTEARFNDQRALLATLFASRGTIMLTAGNEFGHTQRGNNNAYAQDNEITWLDWSRNHSLEEFAFAVSDIRRSYPCLRETTLLTGRKTEQVDVPDVEWLTQVGKAFEEANWHDNQRRCMIMVLRNGNDGGRVALLVNGDDSDVDFRLPLRRNFAWEVLSPTPRDFTILYSPWSWRLPKRTVVFAAEKAKEQKNDAEY